MSVVRALRLLIFGETWTLPVGVAAVLGVSVALRAFAPGLWHDAGGLVLLAGVVAVLAASVVRGSRA